jgi:GTP-binding protein HflX
VDLSHPAWESQIASVLKILSQMPIQTGPMLMVFNKLDRVKSEDLEIAKDKYPHAVFISAIRRIGLETLKQKLIDLIT